MTHSAGSLRKNNKSIAAEKAAKARPPPRAAFGPAFRARTPPARKPDDTEFQISFLARYYALYGMVNEVSYAAKIPTRTPSMQHSIPANNAPTFPKPFPLDNIPLPISLNI